jgi:hypothetical protein
MNQRSYAYDRTAGRNINQYSADENASVGQCSMEPGRQCAYNQTRSRFLSADLDAADFSPGALNQRLPAVAGNSGAGLLLVPFRGISPTSVRVPVDLIYLDPNCRVIETVVAFPLGRASGSLQTAAAVMVLPIDSVTSTETRAGDILLICPPDEMKRRLQKLAGDEPETGLAAAPKEEPARPGTGRVLQWEDRMRPKGSVEKPAGEEAVAAATPSEAVLVPQVAEPVVPETVKPAMEMVQPVQEPAQAVSAPGPKQAKKSWLQKLLGVEPPDPRKAQRETLPGLTAYFFTGGTPVGHGVKDISLTGMYVVTSERWYPGTMVRMTLTDRHEPTIERSITLNATVMRWGNDGVGLRFVLQNPKESSGYNGTAETADIYLVAQFLDRLRGTGA